MPGTPGIAQSPFTCALPPATRTLATSSFSVLVFQMRTVVTGSTAVTRPSSIANGPTAAEMFPQLPS